MNIKWSVNNKIRVVFLLLFTNFSIAQNESSYIYEIYKHNDSYNGDGINWFLNNVSNTQFYLFGEQHGVDGLSDLVKYIYSSLNEKTTYDLLLEMDAWTCDKINDLGIETTISKYPHSVAFDYDDYLELIKSSETSLFGLDQMITAIHPFQRLAEIAPNENARRLSQGAYLKAALKMGKYLRETHFTDIEAIKKAFGKDISQEASQIFEALETSMNIYVAYMKGQKGELDAIVSNKMRESYMIKQFDKYLDASKNNKAVIKLGGAHIMKGIGPNNVPTLGNHIVEFVRNNDMNALSVTMYKYNEERSFLKPDIFKNTNTVLIDCKAYLEQLTDSTEIQLTSEHKKLLKGFDGIVLFNDARDSKKTMAVPHEKAFKNGLIVDLAFGGLLVLICLTSIVPMLIFLFSKSKKDTNYKRYGYFLLFFFIAFALVSGVLIFQFIDILDANAKLAEIQEAKKSIWLFILSFLVALYFLTRVYKIWIENKKWSQKMHTAIISLAFISLISYMYYWNIGGMLSI